MEAGVSRRRRPGAAVAFAVVAALALGVVVAFLLVRRDDSTTVGPLQLVLASDDSRAAPQPLSGRTVAGTLYAFLASDRGIREVEFYLDDEALAGLPRLVERAAPFDLAGTDEDGAARPFDTRALSEGEHTLTAVAELEAGGTRLAQARFTVANGARAHPDPLVAVGADIACDPEVPGYEDGFGTSCEQRATSELLLERGYAAVLALGDLQYEAATYENFVESYDRSWGRAKVVTRPVPGDHEYDDPGAAGYFEYFGESAGDPARGYYSYDVGSWHLVALNSNCEEVACAAGSEQERWLRADLEASAARCTLAYWHEPRFSSGRHGDETEVAALWRALYDHRAELVLSGDDHDYERFAPQDAAGRSDPARGIRQFVVGTGGVDLRELGEARPNSEVRQSSAFGILELTLRPAGYSWRFVAVPGASFTDEGSADCR